MEIQKAKQESSIKTDPENEFSVMDGPIMQSATDALMILSKFATVCLKARGELIPNAVSIANIITESVSSMSTTFGKAYSASFHHEDAILEWLEHV